VGGKKRGGYEEKNGARKKEGVEGFIQELKKKIWLLEKLTN